MTCYLTSLYISACACSYITKVLITSLRKPEEPSKLSLSHLEGERLSHNGPLASAHKRVDLSCDGLASIILFLFFDVCSRHFYLGQTIDSERERGRNVCVCVCGSGYVSFLFPFLNRSFSLSYWLRHFSSLTWLYVL